MGILGSNNAYINAGFLLYATWLQEYKKRCDALVLRLMMKPILATRDICHPSVRRAAAKAVIKIQEYGFPRQKKGSSQL